MSEDSTEVHIRLSTVKADRLKALAKHTDRSLTQLIRDVLNHYLEETAQIVTLVALALLGP